MLRFSSTLYLAKFSRLAYYSRDYTISLKVKD